MRLFISGSGREAFMESIITVGGVVVVIIVVLFVVAKAKGLFLR